MYVTIKVYNRATMSNFDVQCKKYTLVPGVVHTHLNLVTPFDFFSLIKEY